jgi:hypothetical protein
MRSGDGLPGSQLLEWAVGDSRTARREPACTATRSLHHLPGIPRPFFWKRSRPRWRQRERRFAARPARLEPLIRHEFERLRENGSLDVVLDLTTLSRLEEDWDGDGGIAVSEAARDLAVMLVVKTLLEAREARLGWLRPTASTTGDGGVELLWRSPAKELLVVIDAEPATDSLVTVTRSSDASAERVVTTTADAVTQVVDLFRAA